MATSANNYLGYNTYISGAAKNILECLSIVLYNRTELDIEKLSLYNISTVYQQIISSGRYVELTRRTTEDTFNYYYDNGRTNGFDTIIYLSNSDNSAIGYTEFLSIQGKERNINITLAFNSEISGDFIVELSNSLSQLRNNATINKEFVGEELYNYPSAETIQNDVSEILENRPNYTTHLRSIKYSGNVQNIYLGFGILNGQSLYKLNISSNINVDPFEHGFNKYQFGYYKTDIVIYLWKDLDYAIYSVIKRNRFGNPITYTKSSIGFKRIPNYSTSSGVTQTINYFAGKYAIVSLSGTSNLSLIYDTELDKWINYNSDFLIDPMDVKSKIIELPRIPNYDNIINYVPDITNIYLDLSTYSLTNSISLTRKIGDWFVIDRKKDGLVIYTGMTKTLYLSSEETPIIINDQVIMLKTEDTENDLTYYTIYNNIRNTYYTEKARVILESGGSLEYDDELGIMMCKGGTNDSIYRNYYNTGEISIVHSTDSLPNCYFSRFRKNILSNNSTTIPNIIGAIGGILFYKTEQNYLNYI